MTTARIGPEPAKPAADEAFGRAVYMVMFDKHVTQTRLAKELGIDQSAVSRKLRGKRPWLLTEQIATANMLGVDLRDLLAIMWGEPGEPNGITPRRRNNPCYSDARVIKGPWKDTQPAITEHVA